MRIRPVVAAAATTLLATALLAVGAAHRGDRAEASPASPGAKDVIVHLFEWPWSSVANECTTVLGPKGFGGVQVSPPQEHVVLPSAGYPWWQDYQPVSYQLTTRRGDRAAFAGMVRACHAAGVKIYVDAVVNHMAGGASTGNGSGGSGYSQYAYPAVPYGSGDFHHCGRNGNDDIANWGDRWEIQNCELVDLSDLKTESSYVRGKLTAYLNDLVSLGVDGFRVDAAKHLPAADLAAIVDPVAGDPYVFSEVIEGGSGEPTPEEYAGLGDVTEFRYGDVVGGAFRDGNLSGLDGLAARMRLGSADAVAFVDNHDTQRNGRAKLTYKDGAPYALAEAFMIAWPYGVPQVMSSFTFSNPEAGPPAAGNGTTTAVSCGNGWQCEHRARTTANMVALRNAASGAAVTNWWSNGSNQIGFGRGSAAYVAFNRSGSALTRTFQTSLPAGTYCDVMAGDHAGGSCSGPAYTVNAAGQVTATVAANSALALHVGARGTGSTPDGCPSAAVSFAATATTTWGQNVFVTGNTAALGNWNPAAAVPLSSASYPVWTATVSLPGGTAVQYKYIKKEGSAVVWESDPNRSRTTPSAAPCSATWSDSWR
ncbi:alpha-amylase [Actinoplanes sp. NBRC 14428]|uniref:Alpha-amylase n=1 Tax=Pseudosporangium ferrugineum TaxID=439699 RepID=A0A2T0SIU3_9ACTN|nr:carbohydrate-binding module family 20 domain-containing protein [Pseudosporangium ferrugineum]PRY33330.1 alpha-amylase [Pseudosporangium ferrugineum]BCJ48670.1 alpha-amylase [Actinoplanes sp. NBRC 14428]